MKTKSVFGSSGKRFGIITCHPKLDTNGLYCIRPTGCDPALYHPKTMEEVFKINKNRKSDKDPWRYKKELEEWAMNLGYRNPKILATRKWHHSLLGPAWTELNEPRKYEPACKNVGFGRTPRRKHPKSFVPAPGTYYKAVPFKAPGGPHSERPSFEREEPCRFKETTKPWSLAPNRYSIIDKASIEMKSKKLVSTRGPYDLFTGKRDGSTIKNHFNKSVKATASTWPIALKGTLDKYDKSHFGTMNKTGREMPYRGRNALVDLSMCVRKASDPGPGAYDDVRRETDFVQHRYGFNSSYDRPPGYQRVVVWPGVGRYSIKEARCGIFGQGHRHDFLSKIERTIGAYLPQPMNSF